MDRLHELANAAHRHAGTRVADDAMPGLTLISADDVTPAQQIV